MKVLRRRANQKSFKKVPTRKKYAVNETEHEKPLVTYNPVINNPIYLNLLECDKNPFNRLDATCKLVCVATSRDRYYTEMFKTLTD